MKGKSKTCRRYFDQRSVNHVMSHHKTTLDTFRSTQTWGLLDTPQLWDKLLKFIPKAFKVKPNTDDTFPFRNNKLYLFFPIIIWSECWPQDEMHSQTYYATLSFSFTLFYVLSSPCRCPGWIQWDHLRLWADVIGEDAHDGGE